MTKRLKEILTILSEDGAYLEISRTHLSDHYLLFSNNPDYELQSLGATLVEKMQSDGLLEEIEAAITSNFAYQRFGISEKSRQLLKGAK